MAQRKYKYANGRKRKEKSGTVSIHGGDRGVEYITAGFLNKAPSSDEAMGEILQESSAVTLHTDNDVLQLLIGRDIPVVSDKRQQLNTTPGD